MVNSLADGNAVSSILITRYPSANISVDRGTVRSGALTYALTSGSRSHKSSRAARTVAPEHRTWGGSPYRAHTAWGRQMSCSSMDETSVMYRGEILYAANVTRHRWTRNANRKAAELHPRDTSVFGPPKLSERVMMRINGCLGVAHS